MTPQPRLSFMVIPCQPCRGNLPPQIVTRRQPAVSVKPHPEPMHSHLSNPVMGEQCFWRQVSWSFQKRTSWSEQKRTGFRPQPGRLVKSTTGSRFLFGRSLSIE